MPTYHYSKSTRGMYLQQVHGKDIPEDAVEVTDADYRALMDGQSAGHEIVPDEHGRPTLRAPAIDRELLARRADVAGRIDALERRGIRAQRELQLDPKNADAKKRLAGIELQIAALRAELPADPQS